MADRTRTIRRFSWDAVDAELTRALLIEVYRDEDGHEDTVDLLRTLPDAETARQAGDVFGTRIPVLWHRVVVPLLVRDWLPGLAGRDAEALGTLVQLGLTGPDRSRDVAPSEVHRLVRDHQDDAAVAALVVRAFHDAHRVAETVPVRTGGGTVARRTGAIPLRGRDVPDGRRPYAHQQATWRALGGLLASPAAVRGGLVVLPTGAGKTFTMVRWLLHHLAADPARRVLWLADQRELVDQAAHAIEQQARTMPWSFERSMRVVHGLAELPTAVADPRADVVCTTRQSLLGRSSHQARGRLEALLSRPTVVVVDEAHHAVSRTYRELLRQVREIQPQVVVVGLTATPWPMGPGRVAMLEEIFPTRVADVQVRQMVADGILARPTFHTIDTHHHVSLTADEIAKAAAADLPPAVLARLNVRSRNVTVVDQWLRRRDLWGKTLVFAGSIEHADDLSALFRAAGADVDTVHTRVAEPASEVIERFRDRTGPCVLVSVGMLLEGVDIPDARTAVLARPTTSRVVMRQMVGRVLRGPEGGGEAEAHVVDVHDVWSEDVDVLAPVQVLPGDVAATEDDQGGRRRLPPIRDARDDEPVDEDLVRRIEAEYERLSQLLTPLPLVDAELIGFYDVDDTKVPVFDHTLPRWSDLVAERLGHRERAFSADLRHFEDLAAPRPVASDVRAVVDYVRSTLRAPVLVPVRVRVSLRDVAEELARAEAMTIPQTRDWALARYESTLMRSAYPSFQAFWEALQQELLAVLDGQKSGPEDVAPYPVAGLPRLKRRGDRMLEPLVAETVRDGRELLEDAGEVEYRKLLQREHLPPVRWSGSRMRSAWGYWTVALVGPRKGRAEIRVNKTLQAPRTQISDELLKSLIWHELCHHLTPGRGHDAEFRRLEALWPGGSVLDHELDSLHERFDLGWGQDPLADDDGPAPQTGVHGAGRENELPRRLVRGEVVDLPADATTWTVSVSWEAVDGDDADLVVIRTDGDDRVQDDDDFVFYNHPEHEDRSVVLEANGPGRAQLTLRLDQVPSSISTVHLVLAAPAGRGLREVGAVSVRVAADEQVYEADLGTPTSELHWYIVRFTRRGGRWRLRAIGAGDSRTLAELVVHHGVAVDD